MHDDSNVTPSAGTAKLPSSLSRTIAPLFCIVSMSSIQLGGALSRPVLIEYGTVSTTWLRLCVAALVLVVVARPQLRRHARQRWLAALVLGSVMAGMTLCYFESVNHVPLGLAVAINFLGPLAVATVGMRRITMLTWPALAALGVWLLARHDGMWVVNQPWVLLFPVGAALCWAAYIVLMKYIGQQFDGLEGLAASLLVAAAVTTPFGLAQSGGHIAVRQVLDAAWLALLVPLLPYVLELSALRRMNSASFGILMSAEPAIAAATGFVVLSQPLTSWQIAGTLCVVGASIGSVVQK
ncbi:EamA family transporter [Paraburkholderia solisilvae]|uniref:Threonine/homoserine exporter RhtA n=2 Tax=Paraburkholderia solisilvae TaxID=624376 RepID=A0A6J5DG41_9BURK|nr:Threonine/homoserine exporter RhtA [Paraburkholderia solisilvae]